MTALVEENVWLTTNEVARVLKIDPSTLRRWRTADPPQGPPFVPLSGHVIRYSLADLRAWMDSRRTSPGRAA